MSALEQLAPDQRAVVALVLQQGRSYDEIGALLGIPVDAVRGRARAGLAALAQDNGLPEEVTGALTDYLLGQQPPADAAATRALLAESAPARAWAAGLAAQLGELTPDGLPQLPAPAGEPSPVPAPAEEPPPASRLGGALLIAGVLAVVAVVLYLVLSGGDDPEPEPAATGTTPTATATPTPTPAAQVADTIPLRSPPGSDAKGTMTVYLQEGQLLFALEAQDVPPSTAGAAYGVWLTGPGDRARRLGFTNPVGDDGQLGIQGPSANDLDRFPKLYATYARVVVSRETTQDSQRPGPVILAGKLPTGRSGD